MSPSRPPLRVLGIDPGATTGWALMLIPHVGPCQLIKAGKTRDVDTIRPADFANPFELDLVAIESVQGYAHGPNPLARVAHLVAASRLAGILEGRFKAHGYTVSAHPAVAIRKALAGSPQASDQAVARALSLRCPRWPARSSPHERDAALAAIHSGLLAHANHPPGTQTL